MTDLIAVIAMLCAIGLGYAFGGEETRADVAHECRTAGQFQSGSKTFVCGEKK